MVTTTNYNLIYFGVFRVVMVSMIPPLFITEPATLVADQKRRNRARAIELGRIDVRIYLAHAFCLGWNQIDILFTCCFEY